MIWRVTTWMMLLLTGPILSGCAALDLLGGHIPGEDEDLEPPVEVTPYPAARPVGAERPSQPQPVAQAQQTQSPAPIVNPPKASPPLQSATNPPSAPAATSVSDPATKDEDPETESAAGAASVPAKDEEEVKPAASAPAAADSATTKASELSPAPASNADDEAGEQKSEPAEDPMSAVLRHRDEFIAALEEEIKLRSGKQDVDGQLPRLQQQLRLLYLLADRSDDAVGEIESLPEAEQEAFKQLMFGLATWLSAEEDRRPPLRNARILRALKDAQSELAAAARLDVKNLRFCESVEGFGWYKEFPTAQFRARQQVILYAEVENFASEKKGTDSYETELAVSYQIFDGGGTLVDERELPLDKELCHNPRRDYFLAYRVYLPDGVAEGRYRLELTVEDLKAQQHYPGRKLGGGQIEFSIR